MLKRQIDDDVATLHERLNHATRRTEELVEQNALARKQQIESDDRAKEARRINEFWNATLGQMSASDDVQLTLEHIVMGLAREIGAVHVFLFRHSASTRLIRLELSCINAKIRHGLSGEELPLFAEPFPDDITPAWQIMVQNGGLFTPSMTGIPPYEFGWPGAYDYIERFQLSDVGHIVLFAGNDPVGSIGFGFNDGRKLSPSDRPFIEGVAKQAALAIRLLDLAEQAKQLAVQNTEKRAAEKRAEELLRANEAMCKGVEWLAQKQDLRIFLGEMLKAVAEAVGAHAGAVVLLNEDATEYRFAAVLESSGKLLVEDDDILMPVKISLELKAYIEEMFKSPNGCPLAPDDLIMTPATRAHHIKQGNRALRHVPMRAGERLIGWIGLGFANPDAPFEEGNSLPQVLANQMAMAVEMIRLAEEVEKAAVARERERAAVERAAELSKANNALRACMAELVSLRNADQFLATFLRQAVAASGAIAGAVLKRLDETEFEFIFISRDGDVVPAEIAVDPEVNREVRAASSLDPTGHFAKLTAGVPEWRHREDALSVYLPMITQYHRKIGTGILYDFPFGSDSDVTGYLGLAFPGDDPPSQVIQELLTALSTQVGLAVELTRLSSADKAAAIALEQERAAQERADELAKANTALRLGIERVIENQTIESLIETFLNESRNAVHAQGAAVMLRVDGTETTFRPVAVNEDGVVSTPDIIADPYLGPEFENLSSNDPTGIFAAIARGESPSIRVADLEKTIPASYRYHQHRGHSMLWHAPLMLREMVLGYIALSFREDHGPSAAAKETVMALAQQLVLALELARLAKASQESAVRRERENASLERAAELAKANQALRSVNAKLTSDLDLKQFLGFVLAEATSNPKADAGAVFLLDANGNLSPAQWWEAGQASEQVPGYPYPIERPIIAADWALWGTLCAERVARVMQVEDYYGDALAWHTARNHARVIVAPLLLGNEPLGFLGLAYETEAEITEASLQLIGALAEQTTLAVRLTQLATNAQAEAVSREAERVVATERIRQEQEQKRFSAERLQELMHANSAMKRCLDGIGSAQDLDHLQSVVLGSFVDVFGASTGSLWSFDETDGSVTLQLEALDGKFLSRTQSDFAHAQKHFFLPSHAPSYEKHKRLIAGDTITLDIETSDMFVLNEREHLRQNGVVTLIVIPLSAAGRHLGRLALAFDKERRLSPAESEIASTLATQASLVVEMTRLADTSKRLAVAREQERATTEERSRLAREIHDTLAQSFSGIIVQLRAMQRVHAGDPGAAIRQVHADNALELASTGLAEARRSLASLRLTELEGRSLREALILMAQSTAKRSGIPVRVDATLDLDFGVENEPELLRIAQESVTNAVKHSGASQIVIALRREGRRYSLCIEDNGKGFDLEKSTEGFGLIGIQERAGRIGATVTIDTTDAGTAVCVHLERGDVHAS